MKLKPLLPTLREKKRYVLYEVLGVEDNIVAVSHKEIAAAISTTYAKLYGEVGLSQAGLLSIKEHFDANTLTGVIRVNHTAVEQLKASLSFVKQISNNHVTLRSVSTSGILKKVRKANALSKGNEDKA